MSKPSADPLGMLGAVLRAALDGRSWRATLPAEALPAETWLGIVAAADRGFALPALAGAVHRLPDLPLPDGLREFLDDIRLTNAKRNAALRAELDAGLRLLAGAGVEPVLLKGALRLVDDLYPDPAWRLMADLDLLIEPERVEAAARSLAAVGFVPATGEGEHSADIHHLPGLRRPEGIAMVELHHAVLPERFARVLPAAAVLERSRRGEGTARMPALLDQLIHLVAHAQLQHRARLTGQLRLRDMIEGWLLLRRLGPESGPRLVEHFGTAGFGRTAEGWLLALDAVLGLPEGHPSPAAGPLARVMAGRALLQERHRWARIAGELAGHYLDTAAKILASRQGRQRFLRGLGAAGFCRRRIAELRLLLRDAWS